MSPRDARPPWVPSLFQRALPRAHRQHILGDLAEEYATHILPRVGPRRAALWYWWQLVRAVAGEWTSQARGSARRRGTHPLAGILRDARYALRGLRRSPLSSSVAVVTLALGIGAPTAVFSLAHQIIIERLPYPEEDRLVRVYGRNDERGFAYMSVSPPNFADLRALNRSFEALGAYEPGGAVLTGLGEPERLSAGRITPELFPLLGIEPVQGAHFPSERTLRGGDRRLVLLSHRFYATHFEPGAQVTGTTFTLDGEPFTVAGVLPAGEDFLARDDVYVPLIPSTAGSRGNNSLFVTGRLREGVGMAEAQQELNALAFQVAEEHPAGNLMTATTLQPYRASVVGTEAPRVLTILLGAVGFVLLLAAANLTNLLLARASQRRREVAIASALGAGRGTVMRQMLTESTLLAVAGGTVGVGLAVWSLDVLKTLDPGGIPRLAQVAVNGWVLLFAAALTMVTAVTVGALPAWQVARTPIVEALKQSGGSQTGDSRHGATRHLLVAVQMALSLVLLIGAGLMVRSFLQLQHVGTGFATNERLLFDLELPRSAYGDRDAFAGFMDRFLTRIGDLSPVEAVGAVSVAPMARGNTNMPILAEGQVLGEGERTPITEWRLATPGYFRAMGLSVLGGRVWDDLSREESLAGVVISQHLAQQLWGDEHAVGKRPYLRGNPNLATPVIGVVSDQVDRGLERGVMNMVFYSYGRGLRSPLTFVVHTAGDPATVLTSVRAVLREIDPNLPISNVRTLDEIVDNNTARRSLMTFVFLAFAAAALLLACAGLYGVMAYSVSRRTSEIAVRMALGGEPSGVVRLIVGQGMRWAFLGAVAGIVVSIGLMRFMEAMLFDVMPFDPTAWYTVTLVLLGTALLSCVVPALRIARLDPAVALREE